MYESAIAHKTAKELFSITIQTTESNLQDRLSMLFKIDWEKNKYQISHLLLTWLWIVLGALAQFIVICIHVTRQHYLPTIWKTVIVISGLLMLGPTLIFSFCLDQIISFNLKSSRNKYTLYPTVEQEVQRLDLTLAQADAFASKAKMFQIILPKYT